uniref:LysR family transcriptional regulator n=1 Tax=Chamaesiphon sp. TaxID=2814140 RepID=UPI003593B8B1
MDISVLQLFVEVFRQGSFAAAARDRNLDPSSVSRAIAIRDKLRSDRSCQAGLRRWLKEELVATSYMFRKRGNNQFDVGFTNRF